MYKNKLVSSVDAITIIKIKKQAKKTRKIANIEQILRLDLCSEKIMMERVLARAILVYAVYSHAVCNEYFACMYNVQRAVNIIYVLYNVHTLTHCAACSIVRVHRPPLTQSRLSPNLSNFLAFLQMWKLCLQMKHL